MQDKLSTFENKIPTVESIKIVVNAIYDDETIVPYFYESKIPNKNRDDSINEINEQLKLLLKDENKNKIIVNGDPVIQIGKFSRSFANSLQEIIGSTSSFLNESFSAFRLIKTFNLENLYYYY